ncbi:ATP-binding protein [Pseudoalteromonas sp. MMG005]|uniref:hybrid sensor histidine kinase/response regulator n=1 Tax=Pseudoalteromonas sp. MMG005 TaxID=2822682 RepID=UPI001B39F022|nr:ATP-binding protein [Pseudoalteromonas sp. MMG005]MBQ4844023.1 response regulator [Pseudoalteromonas sp. MMG005]
MQNSSSIKIAGLLPLILMIAVITGAICATAAYMMPKATIVTAPNIQKQADELALPLANIMMKTGFGQAKQILQAIKEGAPNIDIYLYSSTGMAEPSLIFQTSNVPVAAISQQKKIAEGGTITIYKPLKLDGQAIGELILRHHSNAATKSPLIGYILFVLALICAFILAVVAKKRIVSQLNGDTKKLEAELKLVVDKQDYRVHLNSDLGFGLESIAFAINNVLHQVQSVIDNNQESQKELKQLQTSLETEVQARTLALEKATLNAERANDAKTTFLATMSHEIRTPMNGVIGTIDLLRQTELDGAQHRLTTIIRDSAFSLLGILDDILDFSKIEAGKLQIDNSVFSVSETIEEVARVLSSVAKKRKLDLELAIAPDIPNNLVGDTVRVRQVLYNLCSNAIKFTTTEANRQGFVKISVEVAQNTSEHYTLRFRVTDNGKGMTQTQLREIFNPFIQAEGSITREFGGTGLGLSICKSLIELMLGSIQVNSDIGMGSEFVVELPFSTQGKVEYAHKSKLEQRRVVVLTNNNDRRNILCRYLSFMGANTVALGSMDEFDEFQYQEKVIWVLDGLEGMAPVNDQLRSLLYSLENNKQQVIVLSTMDEAAVNHQNIFYLNAAPLCKSSFMTSVMVAAGLHKPKALKPSKSMNTYLNVDQARAENKLVLLVEDNVLNQQVLTDQLHLLGYGVEVAENGEEGLEVWQKGNFPIILTDLHMPKMSGYDMVTQIRDIAEQSADINAQPYIIAVTANALKGERERCIATGMNDYITKPVELNVLEATLLKWQEKHAKDLPTPAAQSTSVENESASVNTEDTVDMSQGDNINELAALSESAPPVNLETLNKYVNHDEAKQLRFFRMYLEQSSMLTREVNGAVISMDQNSIVEACHQLKSISNTIGAEKVAETAIEFERQCKENDLSADQLIALRDRLDHDYAEATAFIQSHLQQAAMSE